MSHQFFFLRYNKNRVFALAKITTQRALQTLVLPVVHARLAKRMGTVKHNLHGFVKANATQIVVVSSVGSPRCCRSLLFFRFLFAADSSLKLVVKVCKLFKNAS